MKRILFVAPASLPVNSAEAIVNIKILRLLSNSGYIIDVISKKSKREQYPDIEYEDLISKLHSLQIIEVDNSISLKTIYLHFRTLLRFGIVFKGAHWAFLALNECLKLLKCNKYDYVITKNYPSELVGFYLKKKKGLKWIATWNDPYPHEKYPYPYGSGPGIKLSFMGQRLLNMMEVYPDVHLFPSERLRNYMLSYLNIDIKNTRVAPHLVENVGEKVRIQDTFLKIIHTGNLRYPRIPDTFLYGFDLFLSEHPDAKIKISFLGVFDPNFPIKIKELNLYDYVEIKSSVSYKESLELLEDYDIAMIIEAPCEEGIFLPTKVGDYLQYSKTIFSVSPVNGVLNDLYKEGYVTYFASCVDTKSVCEALSKIYSDFESGNLTNQSLEKYEYSSGYLLQIYDAL